MLGIELQQLQTDFVVNPVRLSLLQLAPILSPHPAATPSYCTAAQNNHSLIRGCISFHHRHHRSNPMAKMSNPEICLYIHTAERPSVF